MNCTHCGAAISTDWNFCSACGTAVITSPGSAVGNPQTPDKMQPTAEPASPEAGATRDIGTFVSLALVAVVVLVLAAIILTAGAGPRSSTSSSGSEPQVAAIEADAASDATSANASGNGEASEAASSSNWTYSEDTDKIRNAPTYFATTTSVNTIHQDPPYDSATSMQLTIRKSQAYGVDVIFTISSGQMMCPSYEGCSGTIKFDNGPAQRVRFAGPADNSSDTIFLQGARAFIAKLRTAKKLVVEKTLYEAGNPQFEFEVAGFKWAH